LSPQPDRASQHQDVGGQHLLEDGRPVVAGPPVLAHIRPHAGRDVVVDGSDQVDNDAIGLHDLSADVDQT
jgi:hypothetical protein